MRDKLGEVNAAGKMVHLNETGRGKYYGRRWGMYIYIKHMTSINLWEMWQSNPYIYSEIMNLCLVSSKHITVRFSILDFSLAVLSDLAVQWQFFFFFIDVSMKTNVGSKEDLYVLQWAFNFQNHWADSRLDSIISTLSSWRLNRNILVPVLGIMIEIWKMQIWSQIILKLYRMCKNLIINDEEAGRAYLLLSSLCVIELI